ncbi:beta-hexosaminidase subunit beta-like [Pollicipes pollicipes]|uniref:beta-hexosaminidase subunit beta-like n=1 Tax=Pollicipes pollicipes TaxID=41117 RepID=UPI001884E6B1|nr:beta-hexosaminidase subunit beta-like [Pollicipes pollicipes]
MDETYRVDVDAADSGTGVAFVTADSLWGVLRGLETFTQLMFSNGEGGLYIRQASIADRPRYSHRGVLLDTSRHYFRISTIKDFLDAMAMNKFNVFHWHIVDDQSFPFVSIKYPALAEGGAYSEDMVYTVEDVEDIIEYARVRGIRVIPEFDTPGHTESWGVGLPGFTTTCYGDDGLPDGTFGPVDPSNEDVYTLMTHLLEEIVMRFPEKYIHLGGDEVSFGFNCWLSNPQIQAWMKSLNISTPQEIESVYIARLLSLVEALPTSPEYVIWQEVIDNDIQVKPATIVEVWKGGWEAEMNKVTGQGLRAILSSCWYLDHINNGNDWQTYYNCEPESFGGTDAQNQLVIGGEACMWSEYVDDTNVMPRVWPRASSVAERLWSPKDTEHNGHTGRRMEEHRCRMVGRGYDAEPPNGPGFC